MIDLGKKDLLGVQIDATDYESATTRIVEAARNRTGYAVSALAIHGVMTTVFDRHHRARLNNVDLVTPDGQGVRWGLQWLHGLRLPDRVYGPQLVLDVCRRCRDEGYPIFLYGSVPSTLDALARNLEERFPGLEIAGREPSRFATVDADEQVEIANRIISSGARVVLVGLGCPRQEVFVYEMRDLLAMPCLAVGAAFDYHAGNVSEPPAWMQQRGLHGFYRLFQEPRRLWKRFLVLPPVYLTLLGLQYLGLRVVRPDPTITPPTVGYA